MALAFLATFATAFGAAEARAETRTLKLYFVHTKEKAEITYKQNGRYIRGGLDKLNRFLRDWRRNEPTKMDPHLMDLLWEAYRATGSREYIHVVSAYRSPATNAMLRSRSKGVAQKSQHMLGKAIDFYIPGVSLSKLRSIGLKLQGGGVGYYPRSGSPFVHLDVGNVRHWPRMSRKELVAVFPNGKTLHVPTDGKPLPGYEQALASYKARRRSGETIQIANAAVSRPGGFLSALFGGGADEAEESSGAVAVASAAGRSNDSGAALPGVKAAQPQIAAAPRPAAPVVEPKPAEPVAEPAPPAETPETIIAALPVRSVPLPVSAPRPDTEIAQVMTAFASPDGEVGKTLAEAQAIASSAPLPSYRPVRDEASGAADVDVAAARFGREAATSEPQGREMEDKQRDLIAKLVAQAPAEAAEGESFELASLAPVPSFRPGERQEVPPARTLSESAETSSLPADVPLPTRSASGKGARVTLAAAGASLPTARPDMVTTGSGLETGVKTTQKSAKPRFSDGRPEPRPVVIPVEQVASRWALEAASRSMRTISSATEPSLAYNAIRTAPKQVYTTGFEQPADIDPARFSGNAVTFLSVAKFNAN